MPLERRDFMKVLGVSLASLLLARCRSSSVTTAPYTPVPGPLFIPPSIQAPPSMQAAPSVQAPPDQDLRLYWRFDELAQKSREDPGNKFGKELIAGHRAELDEWIANGTISAPVADLVQEAYEAAVYHVWRSNTGATCYMMIGPGYGIDSARVLVEQATVLNQIAEQGKIDKRTLAKARTALEHDMAFYALTDEEVQALYDQWMKEHTSPEFEDLSLELTPEAKEATRFLIDLLTGK